MAPPRKLSDSDIDMAFSEIAKGRSLRSLARQKGVTAWGLSLRLVSRYGAPQYKAAISRRGTIPTIKECISELPARKQEEAERWLEENLHHLIELDSQYPSSPSVYLFSKSQPFKLNLNENLIASSNRIPY